MTKSPSEWDIQRAFTIFFKGEKYPKTHPRAGEWKIEPAGLPNIVAWHTPNGGERRDAFEGMRLQQTGVEAGIHDYLFLSPRSFPGVDRPVGILFGLEFKAAKGALHASQIAMHPRMLAAGMWDSATIYSLDAAKEQVRRWGLVRPGC